MSEKKIEEETYSLIFSSLKHPIRRRILRMLAIEPQSFSEILDTVSIDSGHLSYHMENLGDLVKHSANGKYELSSVGRAAVNLMSGVEERPQLLTLTRKLRERKVRKALLGVVLTILIASVALNIYYSNSLQASLEKNRGASVSLAENFATSVWRATDITYLLITYRVGLRETDLNEANIEAVIEGFFHEMDYAYHGGLMHLTHLNPELSEYGKPLYLIHEFVFYTIINWESFPTPGPTVRSVLGILLSQASQLENYSIPLAAFKELNQTSFQKIRDLSSEVLESFAPFNATRLNNTINMVGELQGILGQWIDKYSQR